MRKIKIFLLIVIFITEFSGCSFQYAPHSYIRQTRLPMLKLSGAPDSLKPMLPENISLKIYVKDMRPKLETEQYSSGDYQYSGIFAHAANDADEIANDLGHMAIEYGGAAKYRVVKAMPEKGPIIIFTLDSWYSKGPYTQEIRGEIPIDAGFSGTITMKYDDTILSSRKFSVGANTGTVNIYADNQREMTEAWRTIWAMMNTTFNNAQKKGYQEILNFLQQNWPKFTKADSHTKI